MINMESNLSNVNVNLPQIGAQSSLKNNKNNSKAIDDENPLDVYDERVPQKSKNMRHTPEGGAKNRASNENLNGR